MYPSLYEGIHDPALKQVYQQSGSSRMYPTLYEGTHGSPEAGISSEVLKQVYQQSEYINSQDVPNTV